jgi:hypothetical protein
MKFAILAIRRMFSHFDAGQTEGLADLLEFVPDDEKWQVPADRWLASLQEVEERAQAIIHKFSRHGDCRL